jgi:hypothetical protein
MSRLIVVCLVLAPLAACLQPAAGDTCNPEDSAACASTSVALYCVGGSFQAVPCRGEAGCIHDADRIICDLAGAHAGDACPRTSENLMQCDVSNANQALLCKNRVWQTVTCQACAIQGGQAICR